MGDTGDDYRVFRKLKQTRHNNYYERNISELVGCGFVTVQFSTTIHIKAPHTFVLFYPHTGRWQVKGFRNMHTGGAKKCLEWLRNIESKATLNVEDRR